MPRVMRDDVETALHGMQKIRQQQQLITKGRWQRRKLKTFYAESSDHLHENVETFRRLNGLAVYSRTTTTTTTTR